MILSARIVAGSKSGVLRAMLARILVERIVRSPLPVFGMSNPILSIRPKLSALRSKAE